MSFLHRMTPLLLTTLLTCTPSPPSSPMRRWCMVWVQAWRPPTSHITSLSIHLRWLFTKSHSQVCVIDIPYFPENTIYPDGFRDGQFVFVYCLCSAPRSKRKRCCQNNAQCYGGSGGTLLLLGLLALAIWLGGTLCLLIQITWHKINLLFWFIHNCSKFTNSIDYVSCDIVGPLLFKNKAKLYT